MLENRFLCVKSVKEIEKGDRREKTGFGVERNGLQESCILN